MKITTHSKQTLGYEDLQKLAKHQKWTIRTLLFLLVIICTGIAWIVAYKAAEGFWLKNIVISAVQPGIRQAKAAELTIEEYICTKQWDCKTALAIAKAESGMRCDAQNVNRNGSVDAGLWQVNSVHLKKGWKLVDLLDCKKATDYAYEIYKAQGFNPWVAYWSGAYKRFIN